MANPIPRTASSESQANIQDNFQQSNACLRAIMLVISVVAKIFGGSFLAIFGALALGGAALLAKASISTALSVALIAWFCSVLGISAASLWQAAYPPSTISTQRSNQLSQHTMTN